jgi:DNA primase
LKENWVDYKAVKSAVSMGMVLDRYGVAVRRVNKTALRGACPLPSHGAEGGKASFGVNPEKNAWACLSESCVRARGGRKGGNVLDFVAVMESCTVRDAALKLQSWFMSGEAAGENGAAAAPARAVERSEPVGESASAGNGGVVVNAPLPFTLRDVDSSHPYLATRGIGRETAEEFSVGFFPGKGMMAGRVVIPIHNAAGELVAYAGRALDDATEPRYKLPAGFDGSRELYNYYRARKTARTGTVVVVRGFFSAMAVHQAGFLPVVALMGFSLSDAQADLLGAFDRVLLMLGGGEAGAEATANAAARLVPRCFVRSVAVPGGGQPDECSTAALRDTLIPFF